MAEKSDRKGGAVEETARAMVGTDSGARLRTYFDHIIACPQSESKAAVVVCLAVVDTDYLAEMEYRTRWWAKNKHVGLEDVWRILLHLTELAVGRGHVEDWLCDSFGLVDFVEFSVVGFAQVGVDSDVEEAREGLGRTW